MCERVPAITPRLAIRRVGLPFVLALCIASSPTIANELLEGLDFKHGIAFFDELKYPAGYTHLDYLNPEAPKGGTLVLPTQSNFNTLAPAATSGIGVPSGFWFNADTLLIRAGDEVTAFYGRLADGVAITPDQMAMVFRIHPEARWRDGVAITSRDVAYTLNLSRNDARGAFMFEFIESVEEIDARHVAIHLHAPVTLNNIIMIQFSSILPEHYWRDRDPSVSTMDIHLSSGPYQIAAIEQGRFVEYKRDPAYWGKDIPVNKGRYNFDTVRFEVYRDATVIREAFRKGLIDIWTEPDVRYWHRSYDTPAAAAGWIKKIYRNFGIEVGVRSNVALNNRLEKFSDRRVRLALTLAMDFEWQNRALHHGYYKRAHSYWPDTILAATDMPSDDEVALLAPWAQHLPPELFTRPFRFPEPGSPGEHRHNMLRARALLQEAGWAIAADGVLRNARHEAFEIEFLSANSADARTLLPYFKELEQLGIAGSIRLAETSQYINRRRQFDFDAILQNQDILMPPVIELKSTYHSEAAMTLSRNISGIQDPVLDFLIGKANLATTLPEMVAACRAIDRVLLWQYYGIPLRGVDLRKTVHWDRFGRPAFESKYWPAFPDGWWFDPARAARIGTTR